MGNVSSKENNVVVVKQERTSSLTGYSHYSPSSPSDSWISTDDFPAELDELNEQFEIQLVDKIQLAGEQVDATVAFQESEEEKEEVSDDSDEDYVPEYTKPAKRKRGHRGTLLQGVTDARARIQFLSRGRREAR